MKIEQLIVQHLYSHKKVSLQGIGYITLNPSVALPSEGEKDFQMPDNAFTFEYNLKAEQDEALINFVIQQTRKIRPLATADVESYSILSKQFLNIGKPLVIDGVGTIQKNQAGDYEFIPGHFITPKIEEQPRQVREKADEEISFESESKPNNSRRNMMAVFFIIIAVLAGLGAYYFFGMKKPAAPQETVVTEPAPVMDTVKKDTTHLDTTMVRKPVDTPNTVVTAPVASTVDTNHFKVVLKDYPTEAAANKAFAKLTEYGHEVNLVKKDSTHYQVVMSFESPLSDTLRTKDSLRKFFGGKPYVLIQ